MENFKDESFIAQYLSPKIIRDYKLFSLLDDEKSKDLLITAIHDEDGYQYIRQKLSAQYDLSIIEPNIQVYDVNVRGDRTLILRHVQYDSLPLHKNTQEVLKHMHLLWGFDVLLESVNSEGKVIASYRCPQEEENPEVSSPPTG
jgi:spore cortex formation protein SpoVR/YcgB (stage V sporulation)